VTAYCVARGARDTVADSLALPRFEIWRMAFAVAGNRPSEGLRARAPYILAKKIVRPDPGQRFTASRRFRRPRLFSFQKKRPLLVAFVRLVIGLGKELFLKFWERLVRPDFKKPSRLYERARAGPVGPGKGFKVPRYFFLQGGGTNPGGSLMRKTHYFFLIFSFSEET